MNESSAYRWLAVSMLPIGLILVLLGWIAGGGGLIITMGAVSGSLIMLGTGLVAIGPWLVLLRYQTILRRRRSREAEES